MPVAIVPGVSFPAFPEGDHVVPGEKTWKYAWCESDLISDPESAGVSMTSLIDSLDFKKMRAVTARHVREGSRLSLKGVPAIACKNSAYYTFDKVHDAGHFKIYESVVENSPAQGMAFVAGCSAKLKVYLHATTVPSSDPPIPDVIHIKVRVVEDTGMADADALATKEYYGASMRVGDLREMLLADMSRLHDYVWYCPRLRSVGNLTKRQLDRDVTHMIE